jgi:hypothetical protein
MNEHACNVTTMELLFWFFGNIHSTLVEPCFEPHKIPKNFSSDEVEDNAMLFDVRRETKKKKNPKIKNTTFITSY